MGKKLGEMEQTTQELLDRLGASKEETPKGRELFLKLRWEFQLFYALAVKTRGDLNTISEDWKRSLEALVGGLAEIVRSESSTTSP